MAEVLRVIICACPQTAFSAKANSREPMPELLSSGRTYSSSISKQEVPAGIMEVGFEVVSRAPNR